MVHQYQASLLALFAAGCSLFVNPDEGRLGSLADGGTVSCASVNCDDQIECTDERCVDGACERTPDDAKCAQDERCDLVAGCVQALCEVDADCDNGDACDGIEICTASRCRAGQPIVCDDGIACTIDRCDDGACQSEPDDTLCIFEDLCVVGVCGAHPEADGRGCRPVAKGCDDGDGCTLDVCRPDTGECEFGKVDDDGDGSPAVSATCQQGDCDDNNPSIYPGAEEFCNRRDENCSGRADENCSVIPNSCLTAETIELDVGETQTLDFEISRFTNDYTTSCHAASSKADGPDAVYRIAVDGENDVLIDTTESDFDTIVVTRAAGCTDSSFRAGVCDDDSPGTNPLGSRIWRQRTNDFFLLIDSVAGSRGRARVKLTATKPKPNLCGDSLDISEGGTWIGKSRNVPFYSGACDGVGSGREGLANFVSAGGGKARFEALAFAPTFFNPGIYIFEDNCNISLACDGSEPLLLEPTLEAGKRYILFVDGASNEAPFALKFTPP